MEAVCALLWPSMSRWRDIYNESFMGRELDRRQMGTGCHREWRYGVARHPSPPVLGRAMMGCIICSGEIPAVRIKRHPNVLTCGKVCHKKHHIRSVAAWVKRRRERLRKAALCVVCGEVPTTPGHRCNDCRMVMQVKKQMRQERAAQHLGAL